MMRNVLAMVLVLATAAAVRGDDSARPDPRALLSKANDAATNLKAISYEAKFHGEGVVASQVPTISGKIVAQRGDKPDQPRVRLEGTVAAPGSREVSSFKFASNGQKAYRIEDTRKRFFSGEAADAFSPELNAMLPPKFLADAPYKLDLSATEITHEGVEEIDGVECDKVKVVYDPANGQAMTYWFGRKDHLVRRLENTLRVRVPGRPSPESGRIVFVASNLDASPDITGRTFTLTPPEGYQAETFEPKPKLGSDNLLVRGSHAPDWELKTRDGKSVSLKSLRGKIVVMDFWASWCAPCKYGMPGLEKIHKRFKDEPVVVVGINCRQRHAPLSDAYKVVEELGLTYTQLYGGDQVAENYFVNGIPCMYVIDSEGKVAWAVGGWQPNIDEMTANLIAEMLKVQKELQDKKE